METTWSYRTMTRWTVTNIAFVWLAILQTRWTFLINLTRSNIWSVQYLTPPLFPVSNCVFVNIDSHRQILFIYLINVFLYLTFLVIWRMFVCIFFVFVNGNLCLSDIHAKKTLLPESPYHVTLQVTDESLLEGYGPNSVSSVYRLYLVNTHWQTTWSICSICNVSKPK